MSQTTAPLYERLGRREGITRITKDLMKIHLANPLVKTRYENSEDLERVDDVMAALEKNDIDTPTRNDVLAILWSLKGEVVRV